MGNGCCCVLSGSTTCENLLRNRAGVFHVFDNALLIAQTAIGIKLPPPACRGATSISGDVLENCYKFFEFCVEEVEMEGERYHLHAQVVHHGQVGDFLGFNRAKHAVIEAAIIATRLHLLSPAEIPTELARLQVIVDKTGGPEEHEAMALLRKYCHQHGIDL
ncbi:MAG: DUF447 family protein [Zavarzinella sp.]